MVDNPILLRTETDSENREHKLFVGNEQLATRINNFPEYPNQLELHTWHRDPKSQLSLPLEAFGLVERVLADTTRCRDLKRLQIDVDEEKNPLTYNAITGIKTAVLGDTNEVSSWNLQSAANVIFEVTEDRLTVRYPEVELEGLTDALKRLVTEAAPIVLGREIEISSSDPALELFFQSIKRDQMIEDHARRDALQR